MRTGRPCGRCALADRCSCSNELQNSSSKSYLPREGARLRCLARGAQAPRPAVLALPRTCLMGGGGGRAQALPPPAADSGVFAARPGAAQAPCNRQTGASVV